MAAAAAATATHARGPEKKKGEKERERKREQRTDPVRSIKPMSMMLFSPIAPCMIHPLSRSMRSVKNC